MTHFEDLKRGLHGSAITRSEAGYEAARTGLLYNGRTPARFPEIIVRAADASDVQTTVRHAARHGLRVSPRGSGHNWSGIALQDGIVLDLAALNHIRIDAAARVAEVGPANDNRTLARRMAEHGLAFPLGHCGHVSISGYLLGGGLGWNSGAWGLGCHNVLSVDVVTADGVLRRASETENADLFWAARGAGPAFPGVVTGYRLALHPLPGAIRTAMRAYPIRRTAEVQSWMQTAKADLPANVEFSALMLAAPPHLADRASHVVMGMATVFADTEDEARAALDLVAAFAPAGALETQEMPTPFDALYDALDPFYPQGARFAVDSTWAGAPDGTYLARLADAVVKAPSERCFALGAVVPPAGRDAPDMPDTAFSMMGAGMGLIYAIWDDPAEDGAHVSWLRKAADAVADQTIGHYVGEADHDRPGRLERCFAPEAWQRLNMLRARHDPQRLFARSMTQAEPARLAG